MKAAVLTIVEQLHAAGISKLYAGPIQDWKQVPFQQNPPCRAFSAVIIVHDGLYRLYVPFVATA